MTTIRKKLSIIIPAHNEEMFIKGTILSIINSDGISKKDLEIIIACDSCTDRTKDIADKLGVKTLTMNERSQAKVSNYAAKQAKGDIFVFLGADTKLSPKVLKQVQNAVYFDNAVGGRALIKFTSEKGIANKLMANLYSYFLKFHKYKWGGFCFVRRDIFEKVGGYRDEYVYGFDFTLAKDVFKQGRTVFLSNCYVTTSGRRFDQEGWFKHIFLTGKRYFEGLKKSSEIDYKKY